MEILSIQNVCELDGKETHISSCYSDNKVLTINNENISFEEMHPQKNQKWKILLEDDSVYLKNSKGYICYTPEKDPDIFLWDDREQNDIPVSLCKWSIGKNGELYQTTSNSEERYLWVADDHLRVVSDGYLADVWKIQDDLKKNIPPSKDSSNFFIMMISFIIIIGICIIYFLLTRK